MAVGLAGSTSPLVHPLQVLTGSNHGSDSGAPATTTSTTTNDDVAAKKQTSTTAAAVTRNGTTATTARGTSGSATTNSGDVTVINNGSQGGTPPSSPLSDCKAGDLKWVTVTNHSSYKTGDSVDISLRARNISDNPCYSPSACSASAWATVTDSSGKLVYENAAHLVGCTKPATQPLLNPGDAHDYGVVGSWEQNNCTNPNSTDGCPGDRVATGSYAATAHRGNVTASSATIALV